MEKEGIMIMPEIGENFDEKQRLLEIFDSVRMGLNKEERFELYKELRAEFGSFVGEITIK